MDNNQPAFRRDEFLDKPGIVGARWWHEGMEHTSVGRRSALKALFLLGGVVAAGTAIVGLVECAGSSSSSSSALPGLDPDEWTTETRTALDMQKDYGWNFGAATESLTFDGDSKQPFKRDMLAKLPDDLRPSSARFRPYFVPTLFQSPLAAPRLTAAGDPVTAVSLADALRPISTPAMDAAYRRGKALASLFDKHVLGVCVIVDLPGPESVAFAAGAASMFDPVFAFDNWPHPRGVVPAHLTLAAAAYYQPLFARAATARPLLAQAMIVLDRKRLSPYTDETNQFDNRHMARLPSAGNLTALDVKHVLYVAPSTTDKLELDDLNDDFVHYKNAGILVKLVGADAFGPDPSLPSAPGAGADDGPPYYYGSSAASHDGFWTDYPWVTPPHPPPKKPAAVFPAGKTYVPWPRTTIFSNTSTISGSGSGSTVIRTNPTGFGAVPVVLAVGTGVILGAKLSRSGSWNRSSGGWGG